MLKFLKSLYGVYKDPPSPNWHIERKAKKSKSHPLSGFWKRSKCHDFGLAIGPVSDKEYYISFCGPGGCFEKGMYRPNSSIIGDNNYQIIDDDVIEVKSKKGFRRYYRVESRESN